MNGFDEFSRGLDDDYATDGTLYSTSDADIQRLTRRMQKRLDKLSEEEMNAKAHLGESWRTSYWHGSRMSAWRGVRFGVVPRQSGSI